jgi:hypothetical protein
MWVTTSQKRSHGILTGGRLDNGRNRPPAVVTVNVKDAIRSGIRAASSVVDEDELKIVYATTAI